MLKTGIGQRRGGQNRFARGERFGDDRAREPVGHEVGLFQAASDEEGGCLGFVGRVTQLEASAPRAGGVDEEGKRLLDECFRIVVQSELEQLAEEIALARQFGDLGVHLLGTLRQPPSEEKRSGPAPRAVESIRHRVRRVPCNGLNTSLIETVGFCDSLKNRVFAVSHLVA